MTEDKHSPTLEEIEQLLKSLNPREIQIICARFGLPLPEGIPPLNLGAVTAVRRRQVESKALRKMSRLRATRLKGQP